ncbi:MAG TPA: PAS domain S-box protein, partial [Anaerolineales bacterium]|nr:PAS domain S-box protein [Anaerolineales bacterium]
MTTNDLRKQVEELSIRQAVLEQQNAELRQLKDNLQESASEFKDLYDNAPVGYLTLDSEARILGSNPPGLTLLQAHPQDVQNRPFIDFVHRKDEDTFTFFHKKLIETHEPQTCFLRVGGQSGENFRYLRLDATTGLNGRPLHIRMTLTDISNQVHAEQYLRTSEQHYRLLAESSQIGIWIINERGQTTYTNPTLGRMLGYSEEEL